MHVEHTIPMHAVCPFNGEWDYYDVKFIGGEVVDVHILDKILDRFRGELITQEGLAQRIALASPPGFEIVVTGKHGQRCDTVVRARSGNLTS
jgi:NADPH-dependent 7-cyano-7-deazaguanine reductase QueF